MVEAEQPGSNYFFLIGEINRANLSKVSGELMYCLESGKRGPEHRVQTQYQNLPTYDPEQKEDMSKDVFAGGFYIPENVYIIGTMNDIDRSVESMDFALRQRFLFKEIKVLGDVRDERETDEEKKKDKRAPPESAFAHMNLERAPEDIVTLADSVVRLNEQIEKEGKVYNLDQQYFVAQGQFSVLPGNVGQTLDKLRNTVWELRIEPLLREYIRGESKGMDL